MKNPVALTTLLAVVPLLIARHLPGQTFNTLYSFSGGGDGSGPAGDLVISGGILYGTTTVGGAGFTIDGYGAVFGVNVDGAGFRVLYALNGSPDGAHPRSGLVQSGGKLYGTCTDGGGSITDYGLASGTVFSLNTDGTGFTVLYSFTGRSTNSSGVFTNSDGAGPSRGLLVWSNRLYGTASAGGSLGQGTLFSLKTDGTDFTVIHTFNGSDGSSPGDLTLSSNTLYGTTGVGVSSGSGTVFAVNADGNGFTTLYSFSTTVGPGVNNDGAGPIGLMLAGNTLYGTTVDGGKFGNGTVFKLNTDGTGFKTLHTFTATSYPPPGQSFGTNIDGAVPFASLILSRNTLYGTTRDGSAGYGSIFGVNTDGTGFTTVHSFSTASPTPCPCVNTDGSFPEARLVLSGNTLYGAAGFGGTSGFGTVFSLFVPPRLTITEAGSNVILTWSTNADGFTLQSTADLSAWTNTPPAPSVVNGLNTVTNPVSGAQQFYRLAQ